MGPTIPLPNGPWFCLAERNLPGSIIVNQAGQRFMNEALPYVEAVHEIYKGEATGVGHVPAWMVIDQRYRNRYLFAGLSPRQPFPGHWYKHGTVRKAATLEALAAEIDVPADALTRDASSASTASPRPGVDEDFHRGESAYDKYYSDPRVKPNPSLHAIDQAPFYAVKIVPGDLGTKGGLVTDERARVLRPDGSVIGGLYAAGNVSSAVMGRTYAGPGATIGPALAFGYLAAEDIAHSDLGRGAARRLMPIRPADCRSAPTSAPRGVRSRWTDERRAALPPRHRRGRPPGRPRRPGRAALHRRRAGPAGAAVVRRRGADVPHDRPAAAGPARLRHQPGPGRARVAVGHRARAAADVRHRRPCRTTLTDVWDKGKAAVIWQEGVATSESGEELWTTRSSIFVRGEGGWGGDRGTSEPVELPDRAPDAETTYAITPQQALLYRLCGDRNPLHSDPDFAKAAGFPAPILHGLCSYGIVLRELTDALLGGDATRVGGFAAKFTGVVYPGETIRVRGWHEDGRILGEAAVARSERRAGRRAGARRRRADPRLDAQSSRKDARGRRHGVHGRRDGGRVLLVPAPAWIRASAAPRRTTARSTAAGRSGPASSGTRSPGRGAGRREDQPRDA